MRVIQFTEYGGPDVLHEAEVPTPLPGPGEVRLRVRAAAVNPADPKWRQGMFKSFAPVSFPHVVGYDVAGTLDAMGEGVSNFAPGERVVVMLNAMTKGGYAVYALAPADTVVRIPDSLDFATAAAIPTAGLTGVQMVEAHAKPSREDLVLITGATGAVGRFALHAAKSTGARIVAAVRASQAQEARELGASEIVVLGEQDWTGAPFQHVIDTVGGVAVAALCRRLADDGTIFTAATTPIDPEGLKTAPVFVVVQNDAVRLKALADAVASGEIGLPIATRLPLSAAAEAHRLVESGGNRGKIILEP